MSSAKGKIVRLFSGMLLKRATVAKVKGVGDFRQLFLQCDPQQFAAGAKVQLLLPSDDMRTYSPIPTPGGMTLLGWAHEHGPGSRWMASAREGDEVPFLGPQRSLELASGPVLIIGDETSVAVAAAFAAERKGQCAAVIQSDAPQDVARVAGEFGLEQLSVVGRGDTDATVQAVATSVSSFPNASIGLTGCSELVVGVRDALRRTDLGANIKKKTYWIPGRAGLD